MLHIPNWRERIVEKLGLSSNPTWRVWLLDRYLLLLKIFTQQFPLTNIWCTFFKRNLPNPWVLVISSRLNSFIFLPFDINFIRRLQEVVHHEGKLVISEHTEPCTHGLSCLAQFNSLGDAQAQFWDWSLLSQQSAFVLFVIQMKHRIIIINFIFLWI